MAIDITNTGTGRSLPVVTVREAAALLGLSERGVQARIERGKLRAIKLSGRWLIDSRAIDAAMVEDGR